MTKMVFILVFAILKRRPDVVIVGGIHYPNGRFQALNWLGTGTRKAYIIIWYHIILENKCYIEKGILLIFLLNTNNVWFFLKITCNICNN